MIRLTETVYRWSSLHFLPANFLQPRPAAVMAEAAVEAAALAADPDPEETASEEEATLALPPRSLVDDCGGGEEN